MTWSCFVESWPWWYDFFSSFFASGSGAPPPSTWRRHACPTSGAFSPPGPRRLGWVGAYSPEARKRRIARFHAKRKRRVWKKSVQYDVRKNFADTRLRVKGRFVKKEDEVLLKELVGLA